MSSIGAPSRKTVVRVLVGAVCWAGVVQLLPFGEAHSNPPTTNALTWPDTTTRALFFRACGDCHSNETQWPWYSWVAPVSWTVTGHVKHGRGTFNVSAWNAELHAEEAQESIRTVRDGSMPPSDYLRLHSNARLSAAEKAQLVQGLQQMPELKSPP